MVKISSGEVEVLNQRQQGTQRTKDTIYEQIANNGVFMEEWERTVCCLKKRSDGGVRQTCYDEKRPSSNVSDLEVRLKTGRTFMGKADVPQVDRMKQVSASSSISDQKNISRRLNTAGRLLNDLKIDTDLFILQLDNTTQIVAGA